MIYVSFIKSRIDYIFTGLVYLFFYFYSVNSIPELVIPPQGTDPFTFDIIADIISKKGLLLRGFGSYFFSTPLYSYFVFIVKQLSPSGIVIFSKVLIFIQFCVFFVSTIYFQKLAGFVFDCKNTRISYYAYSFYTPFIFHGVLPAKDILTISIVVFSLYNLIAFIKYGRIFNAVFCGLFFGAAINFRETFFFIAPLLAFEVFRRSNIGVLIVFILCVSASILPFTLRNIIIGGDRVLLSSVGGIHLYIGNHDKAIGVYTFVKGIRPSTFGHYYDAKKVAEKELGRKLKDSEVNSFWKNKAVEFVKNNPYKALKLIIKKLLLVLNYHEVSNNYGFDFLAKQNLPFKILSYIPYKFALLFIFGVLGFIFTKFRYKYLFVSCFIIMFLSSALIFITDRYRLPLSVFLMAGFISFINDILSKKIAETKKVLLIVLCGFALCSITFYPTFTLKDLFLKSSAKKHKYSTDVMMLYNRVGKYKFALHYAELKRKYIAAFTDDSLI